MEKSQIIHSLSFITHPFFFVLFVLFVPFVVNPLRLSAFA
jgi:hypothetical protein